MDQDEKQIVEAGVKTNSCGVSVARRPCLPECDHDHFGFVTCVTDNLLTDMAECLWNKESYFRFEGGECSAENGTPVTCYVSC